MSINIKNEIKEEAKKVEALVRKDKEKINSINNIDVLFARGFFGLAFIIFLLLDIFMQGVGDRGILLLISVMSSLFINSILRLRIKKINKKNTVSSNIKHLSSEYLINQEKRLYFYNKYQELKVYSKDYFFYGKKYREESSLDEVEKDLSKLYIESKNYQFFINYLKNENKELVFEEDYIQNLIYKKTKKCLESIKSINEFNNIKEDLIYTIDLIDLIDKKLELFEIMEKLKDKYDSEVINKKIGSIKDKLLNKNDNKIEIKKSNIRSI